MFCIGLLPVPPADVVIGNTPLFFSAQGSVVQDRAEKEAKVETRAGARRRNVTPTGKFHFPRHISVSNHEYVMESMETKDETEAGKSDGFTYRLDPDRVRTDAVIKTFAFVFRISVPEARRILVAAGCRCEEAFNNREGMDVPQSAFANQMKRVKGQ